MRMCTRGGAAAGCVRLGGGTPAGYERGRRGKWIGQQQGDVRCSR